MNNVLGFMQYTDNDNSFHLIGNYYSYESENFLTGKNDRKNGYYFYYSDYEDFEGHLQMFVEVYSKAQLKYLALKKNDEIIKISNNGYTVTYDDNRVLKRGDAIRIFGDGDIKSVITGVKVLTAGYNK